MGQAREPGQELLPNLFHLQFGKARAFRQAARQADLVDDGLASACLAPRRPPYSWPMVHTCYYNLG